MSRGYLKVTALTVVAAFGLMGCGEGGLFSKQGKKTTQPVAEEKKQTSFFDLFQPQDDPRVTVAVNKYIWHAALEVLDFLPIESADPFSGLIVTGYGTPPGGRVAYRATILVNDPALDARSLNLALMTRNGPVDEATRAAVEDAILTRARQMRVADLNL